MISRKRKRLVEFELRTTCRGGGMADAADLKSVVRKDVRVRLPPSAPQRINLNHRLSLYQHNGVNSFARTCRYSTTEHRVFTGSLASKVSDQLWKMSVPPAVAGGSAIRIQNH